MNTCCDYVVRFGALYMYNCVLVLYALCNSDVFPYVLAHNKSKQRYCVLRFDRPTLERSPLQNVFGRYSVASLHC